MQRISFNPAMLLAVRAGVKTATRRRLLPELPMQQEPDCYRCVGCTALGAHFEDLHTSPATPLAPVPCPLGKAGDILLVQEDPALRLRLLSVRVERVCQLTEADAMAEGIRQREVGGVSQWGGVEPTGIEPDSFHWYNSPVVAFRALLDSIYPTAWARNEWVWVVKFKPLPSE